MSLDLFQQLFQTPLKYISVCATKYTEIPFFSTESFYSYPYAQARVKFYGHEKTAFEPILRSVNSFNVKNDEKNDDSIAETMH